MAFCGKCGQQVNEGVRFCPACGSPMQIVAAEPNRQQTPPPVQPTDAESMAKATATADALSDKLSGMNKTADLTDQFDKADVEQNKVMAILAYFGILVLIPILAAKDSKFARFHAQPRLAFMHRHVWLDHSGLRSDRPLAGDPMEGIGLMEHLLSLRYGIEPRLHRVYGTGSHRYH